jgi:hypothetical protein
MAAYTRQKAGKGKVVVRTFVGSSVAVKAVKKGEVSKIADAAKASQSDK